MVGQVVGALGQQFAVMLQAQIDSGCQGFLHLAPDTFHRLVAHPGDVIPVHHDGDVRQDFLDGLAVAPPHIHPTVRNTLWMLKATQESDDGGLVPILQHIHYSALADIGDDPPCRSQVDFIYAKDNRRFALEISLELGGVLAEDVASGLLVDTDLFSDSSESVVERLPPDPDNQAFRHLAGFVNLRNGGGEGLATGLAEQSWRIDMDHHALAVGGQVADEQRQPAVADGAMRVPAMRAELGVGGRDDFDMVLGVRFLEVQYLQSR